MTNPTKGRTMEQADELVRDLGLAELVEEYELNGVDHIYSLLDGSYITVPSDPEEQPWVTNEDEGAMTIEQYKEGMMN